MCVFSSNEMPLRALTESLTAWAGNKTNRASPTRSVLVPKKRVRVGVCRRSACCLIYVDGWILTEKLLSVDLTGSVSTSYKVEASCRSAAVGDIFMQ